MENFLIFRKFMLMGLDFMSGTRREEFIRLQWNLLRSGVRDDRIHDSACVAWCECGGTV